MKVKITMVNGIIHHCIILGVETADDIRLFLDRKDKFFVLNTGIIVNLDHIVELVKEGREEK